MDTITHGLVGALVGRAYAPSTPEGLTPTQRMITGAIAATLPDLDYATYWIDPARFLSTWHRGPTHSIVLAPLWALLIGMVCAWMLGRSEHRRDCIIIAALALLSHIATDVITVFGTAILFPLSDWRPGLATTMVIDPWFSSIALLGLLLSRGRPGPGVARTALVLICIYVAAQAALQAEAQSFARSRMQATETGAESARAIAQPLSPFHWKVIITNQDGYESSTFNLLDFPTFPRIAARLLGVTEILEGYQPRDVAGWDRLFTMGHDAAHHELAREVLGSPLMQDFREFAEFPLLYRIDQEGTDTCVWFTDLRFVFPGLIPSFRYGLCKDNDEAPWAAYRLRRGSQNDRVTLQIGDRAGSDE